MKHSLRFNMIFLIFLIGLANTSLLYEWPTVSAQSSEISYDNGSNVTWYNGGVGGMAAVYFTAPFSQFFLAGARLYFSGTNVATTFLVLVLQDCAGQPCSNPIASTVVSATSETGWVTVSLPTEGLDQVFYIAIEWNQAPMAPAVGIDGGPSNHRSWVYGDPYSAAIWSSWDSIAAKLGRDSGNMEIRALVQPSGSSAQSVYSSQTATAGNFPTTQPSLIESQSSQKPLFLGFDLSIPVGIVLGLLVSIPIVTSRFRRRRN